MKYKDKQHDPLVMQHILLALYSYSSPRFQIDSGLILALHPANESRRYFATSPSWAGGKPKINPEISIALTLKCTKCVCK